MVWRIQIQPNNVADFLDKLGSADNLNVSTRCDCNPNVCQMREMVAFESPIASAMLRVVHCVAWRAVLRDCG